MKSAPTPDKEIVLGVGVSATSYADVVHRCNDWISRRARSTYICVTSVHGLITAIFDPSFRDVLNRASIVTPDGMPVVWALRSFGRRRQQRVYGPDLMLALCENAAGLRHRIFLYGSRPEVLKELEERLTEKYPGLCIAGTYSPPFRPLTEEEDQYVVQTIRESRASIVFVGISTPKQERWMASHVQKLPNVVLIGVGAAFDFHAGRVRQAPHWMQRAGFEWLFRLMSEPARLWKRYLLVTPLFLPLWALQKIGILRYGVISEQLEASPK
jgi:N-acetylglucosaminyldiphosphoundecaprenol N-acetyl-beta-D-mannosaminyltransferase